MQLQREGKRLVIVRYILLLLTILLSGFAIFSKKAFNAFVYRTILSILVVGLYITYFAPDVALAEAMLGALLTTFIYLLAFKIHSEIKIGILILPVLCEKYQEYYKGIIPEILEEFSKKYNYKIKFIELKDFDEIMNYLSDVKIDIGICYNGDFKILEVPVYQYKGEEKNFFEIQEILKNESNLNSLKKSKNYTLSFCFSDKNSILYEEFKDFYTQFDLEKVLIKHLRRY
ncbi:MAG: putative multicomponent Na+:H+ antiporter subunit [Thermosipho sp. (in: thermotogales)]|nr:putative multicomponent Na+:H+ antiporter subunit [Thermosipho sp. (in: thermotogales)]MDN5324816.1 putative multicomponent Na+:H+ antiporter subunit [Thermosipho sp. (in: thermotogales)]